MTVKDRLQRKISPKKKDIQNRLSNELFRNHNPNIEEELNESEIVSKKLSFHNNNQEINT